MEGLGGIVLEGVLIFCFVVEVGLVRFFSGGFGSGRVDNDCGGLEV